MAGLFSKGRTALTPAQQNLLALANQKQADFRKTWLPVQEYYASQAQAVLPGLRDQAQGQAVGGANAAGTQAQLDALQGTSRSGIGSGNSLTALNRAQNATATAGGMGLAQGDLAARQAYEQGLAKVLQSGLQDQNMAQGGLSTAAGIQSAEQGQQVQSGLGEQQAIGQLAGMAGGLAGRVPSSGLFSFGNGLTQPIG